MHTGYARCLLERNELFDPHFVFPPVAEIVLVEKPFIQTKTESGQMGIPSILGIPGAAQSRDAKLFAIDAEAMKVIVGPSESYLYKVMEIGQGALDRNQQPTPNHRIDASQPNVNPEGRRKGFNHRVSAYQLAPAISAPVLSWSPGARRAGLATRYSFRSGSFEGLTAIGMNPYRQLDIWSCCAVMSSHIRR